MTNRKLLIDAGVVTFQLNGRTYTLTTSTEPSLLVGRTPGPAPVRVNVAGGVLQGVEGYVGGEVDAPGEVRITGLGASLRLTRDLCVGCSAEGLLEVFGGAAALARSITMGDLLTIDPGQNRIVVRDPGSSLTAFFTLIVNRGVLEVASGGEVTTGFGTFVLSDGSIIGDGRIVGPVINFGTLAVGDGATSAIGTLTVDGDYEQVGVIAELGNYAGSLVADVGGAGAGQFDQLVVSGTSQLGGGLFVNLVDDFQPPPGSPAIPLVQTGSLSVDSPRFDVAFFPAIAGGRFLSLDYPPVASRGGSVSLISLPLPGEVDVNDPDAATLAGSPAAVAAGDVDGDGRDDLVVALPDDPASPGRVVVLRTRFNVANGAYEPLATEYTVGRDPAAVALGQFDGQPGLDIAVAEAGEDAVRLLANVGGTGDGFVSTGTLAVGDQPRALAVADFDADGDEDVAVGNTGAGTLNLLLGNGTGFVIWGGGAIPVGSQPRGISPINPDQDKDIDLAISNFGDGSLTLLANVGTPGNFAVGGSQTIPVGAGAIQVMAANLNLDSEGLIDLVTVNRTDGTVSVLVNRARVTDGFDFAPPVSLPLRTGDTIGSEPRSAALIDVDSDGDRDIVVIARNEASAGGQFVARVLRNDQTPAQLAFAPASDLDAGVDPVALASEDLGDIGGGGAPDLDSIVDLDNDNREDVVAVGGGGAFAMGANGNSGGGLEAVGVAEASGSTRGPAAGSVSVARRRVALIGDTNCDGFVTVGDIGGFVLALTDPAAYTQQFPACDIANADTNGDGFVTVGDIGAFVTLLTGR